MPTATDLRTKLRASMLNNDPVAVTTCIKEIFATGKNNQDLLLLLLGIKADVHQSVLEQTAPNPKYLLATNSYINNILSSTLETEHKKFLLLRTDTKGSSILQIAITKNPGFINNYLEAILQNDNLTAEEKLSFIHLDLYPLFEYTPLSSNRINYARVIFNYIKLILESNLPDNIKKQLLDKKDRPAHGSGIHTACLEHNIEIISAYVYAIANSKISDEFKKTLLEDKNGAGATLLTTLPSKLASTDPISARDVYKYVILDSSLSTSLKKSILGEEILAELTVQTASQQDILKLKNCLHAMLEHIKQLIVSINQPERIPTDQLNTMVQKVLTECNIKDQVENLITQACAADVNIRVLQIELKQFIKRMGRETLRSENDFRILPLNIKLALAEFTTNIQEKINTRLNSSPKGHTPNVLENNTVPKSDLSPIFPNKDPKKTNFTSETRITPDVANNNLDQPAKTQKKTAAKTKDASTIIQKKVPNYSTKNGTLPASKIPTPLKKWYEEKQKTVPETHIIHDRENNHFQVKVRDEGQFNFETLPDGTPQASIEQNDLYKLSKDQKIKTIQNMIDLIASRHSVFFNYEYEDAEPLSSQEEQDELEILAYGFIAALQKGRMPLISDVPDSLAYTKIMGKALTLAPSGFNLKTTYEALATQTINTLGSSHPNYKKIVANTKALNRSVFNPHANSSSSNASAASKTASTFFNNSTQNGANLKQKSMIIGIHGNINANSLKQYLTRNNIPLNKALYIFPGNSTHDIPSNGNYDKYFELKKSGDGLAGVAANLYNSVKTSSLCTMGTTLKPEKVREQLKLLMYALGQGYVIIVPTRNAETGRNLELSALQSFTLAGEAKQNVELSFLHGVNTTPSQDIQNWVKKYAAILNAIAEYQSSSDQNRFQASLNRICPDFGLWEVYQDSLAAAKQNSPTA